MTLKNIWEENNVEKLSQVPFMVLWVILSVLAFQEHIYIDLVTAYFQKEFKTTHNENLVQVSQNI